MKTLLLITIFLIQIYLTNVLMINEKFKRLNDLDGYKCHDGNNIFEAANKFSVLDCARHCSSIPTCTGIFYHRNISKCLGCSSQCEISDVTDRMIGTIFYKRRVCPMEDTDWISLPKECSRIQFHKQLVSHSEATAICESIGAHLMKIDERWKMDFVVELLQVCEGLRKEEYWVDGTNTNAANFTAPDAWKFYDGSLVPTDKYFWASHAPNSPETQHCFRIVDSFWDDMHCDFKYWFICEK